MRTLLTRIAALTMALTVFLSLIPAPAPAMIPPLSFRTSPFESGAMTPFLLIGQMPRTLQWGHYHFLKFLKEYVPFIWRPRLHAWVTPTGGSDRDADKNKDVQDLQLSRIMRDILVEKINSISGTPPVFSLDEWQARLSAS